MTAQAVRVVKLKFLCNNNIFNYNNYNSSAVIALTWNRRVAGTFLNGQLQLQLQLVVAVVSSGSSSGRSSSCCALS